MELDLDISDLNWSKIDSSVLSSILPLQKIGAPNLNSILQSFGKFESNAEKAVASLDSILSFYRQLQVAFKLFFNQITISKKIDFNDLIIFKSRYLKKLG